MAGDAPLVVESRSAEVLGRSPVRLMMVALLISAGAIEWRAAQRSSQPFGVVIVILAAAMAVALLINARRVIWITDTTVTARSPLRRDVSLARSDVHSVVFMGGETRAPMITSIALLAGDGRRVAVLDAREFSQPDLAAVAAAVGASTARVDEVRRSRPMSQASLIQIAIMLGAAIAGMAALLWGLHATLNPPL